MFIYAELSSIAMFTVLAACGGTTQHLLTKLLCPIFFNTDFLRLKFTQIHNLSALNKKCGCWVRPTRYAPAGL